MLNKTSALAGDLGYSGRNEGGVQSDNPFIVAFEIVWRKKKQIAACAGLGLLLALLYLATAKPTYTALVEIAVDPNRAARLRQDNNVRTDMSVDSGIIESQIQALMSNAVAEVVIRKQNLLDTGEEPGGLRGIVRWLFPREPVSDERKMQDAIADFGRGLSVKRAGQSYIIDVAYSSDDPEWAARIANAVAEAYIGLQLDTSFEGSATAADWMKTRLQELRTQAEAATAAVLAYRQKNNIMVADGKFLDDQQLTSLSNSLTTARSNVAEAQAKLDRIEAVINSGDLNLTVSDALKSEVITPLRQRYLELAKREAEISARYGKNHTAAANMRGDMERLQTAMREELGRIRQTYRSEYEIAVSRKEAAEKNYREMFQQMTGSRQQQVELQNLESQAKTLTSMYDSFMQRYAQTLQQQSFPVTDVRVVSKATPPAERSSPKTRIVLPVGVILGLMSGVGFALLYELFDNKLRTKRQFETLTGAPCLGYAPVIAVAAETPVGTMASRFVRGGPETYAVDAPFSLFAETMRGAKLAVDEVGAGADRGQIVGIASSVSGEGKSLVAVNLALAIAQAHGECLLIDADMRSPSLTRRFAPGAKGGLRDVLLGRLPLAEAVLTDQPTKVDFLPALAGQAPINSAELLSSDAMRQLAEAISQRYRYVVIDFPPILPVVDARAAAFFVDSYIFVSAWGSTTTKMVDDALGNAPEIWKKLVGTVLNKAEVEKLATYGETVAAYYSSSYFKN